MGGTSTLFDVAFLKNFHKTGIISIHLKYRKICKHSKIKVFSLLSVVIVKNHVSLTFFIVKNYDRPRYDHVSLTSRYVGVLDF